MTYSLNTCIFVITINGKLVFAANRSSIPLFPDAQCTTPTLPFRSAVEKVHKNYHQRIYMWLTLSPRSKVPICHEELIIQMTEFSYFWKWCTEIRLTLLSHLTYAVLCSHYITISIAILLISKKHTTQKENQLHLKHNPALL